MRSRIALALVTVLAACVDAAFGKQPNLRGLPPTLHAVRRARMRAIARAGCVNGTISCPENYRSNASTDDGAALCRDRRRCCPTLTSVRVPITTLGIVRANTAATTYLRKQLDPRR